MKFNWKAYESHDLQVFSNTAVKYIARKWGQNYGSTYGMKVTRSPTYTTYEPAFTLMLNSLRVKARIS